MPYSKDTRAKRLDTSTLVHLTTTSDGQSCVLILHDISQSGIGCREYSIPPPFLRVGEIFLISAVIPSGLVKGKVRLAWLNPPHLGLEFLEVDAVSRSRIDLYCSSWEGTDDLDEKNAHLLISGNKPSDEGK